MVTMGCSILVGCRGGGLGGAYDKDAQPLVYYITLLNVLRSAK